MIKKILDSFNLSLMKQQFVVTQQYKILQETGKLDQSSRPTLKHVMFLRKNKDKELFCGHNILTVGVFVTKLSNNAGISVRRIVWVRYDVQLLCQALYSYEYSL
jgi:hypothetical protein